MKLRVSFATAGLVLATAAFAASATAFGQAAPLPPGVQESISTLADQPATHTGFVFDRSMMEAARVVLQSGGMPPERAAVALKSISFDSYRYPQPAVYVPARMASIIAIYRASGWKHLVDSHDAIHAASAGGDARPDTARGTSTDLWLHFSGTDIDGVTVLTRGARSANVIQIACDLRPLELVHLSGHFGIPKVDPGAVMVPDPKDK